jgi:exonuclease VII small subunit
VKLLESCVMHLDQAQKDTERVRARLANLPWDVVNQGGQGALEEAREFLLRCESKLSHAKKQIELQKNNAGKA